MSSTRVKKYKLTASTPAIDTAEKTRTRIEPLESLSDSFEIASKPKPKPQLQPKKSPMIDLICEAINVIGVPRKGASYVSIKKWILSNSKSATTDAKLIASLKKAFKTGLEKEVLGRPQKSRNLHGLTGFFVVLKKSSKIEIPKKTIKKSKIDDKTKVKSTSNTRMANTAIESPTRRLNLSNSLVKYIKGKKQIATGKIAENAKVTTIKSPKAGTSKGAAKGSPKVAIQRTRKKLSETLVIKTPNAKLTKFAAKRTPKVVVQKTLKTKISKVPVKNIPKAKELVGLSKNAVKRTIRDKAILVPKPEPKAKIVKAKEPSRNTKPKQLFSYGIKLPSNDLTRKDLSDTELEVKRRGRKSLKSYSSDIDVNDMDLNSIKKKQKPSKKLPKK